MKKVITIVGARPQFVKAAVVSRILKDTEGVEEMLVHTGQHFDSNMSEIFFDEMEIPFPKYQFNINSLSHAKMTARMMECLEEVIMKEKPNAILVYGDTNSTLAAALVASKLHVPVGHVEAGLRSFNMKMPEEVNRILTDRVSQWLYCPTQVAVDNLTKEGFKEMGHNIYMTGDVMYDAALYYTRLLDKKPGLIEIPKHPFILATIHRQENTHDKEQLEKVIRILNELNRTISLLMPVHPGTAARMRQSSIQPEFKMIDPVGYFDMIRLLQQCQFVVTDSGGLQKEAFFYNKYCLTLREQTEWVELVENKVNFICGTDADKVKENLSVIQSSSFPDGLLLYGDGHAGDKIVQLLQESL